MGGTDGRYGGTECGDQDSGEGEGVSAGGDQRLPQGHPPARMPVYFAVYLNEDVVYSDYVHRMVCNPSALTLTASRRPLTDSSYSPCLGLNRENWRLDLEEEKLLQKTKEFQLLRVTKDLQVMPHPPTPPLRDLRYSVAYATTTALRMLIPACYAMCGPD
eukprot:2779784-Rhodomonas_salina.3